MDRFDLPAPLSGAQAFSSRPLLVGMITIIATGLLSLAKVFNWSLSKFERIGKSRLWSLLPGQVPMRVDLHNYAAEGYVKVNKGSGKPFMMKYFGLDFFIMPRKYLADLKRMDHESLSTPHFLNDALNIDATAGDLFDRFSFPDIVKNLNADMQALVPILVDELDYAFAVQLGDTKEWKRVNALSTCDMLVSRVNSRVFLGKELCRDEVCLEAISTFKQSLFVSGIFWNFIPLGSLRKLVYRITSVVTGHKRNLQAAVEQLLPTICERLEKRSADANYVKGIDGIEWTLDVKPASPKERDPRRIAHQILHFMFIASGSPGPTVTQMLYQTLMNPEYLDRLREDVRTALAENGGWTVNAVNSMRLMESFVRETLRLFPPSAVACSGKIMKKPFQFHDGLRLPVGSYITFPIQAVQVDPDLYENPETFDAFRFLNKGNAKGASAIDDTFLSFGYGRHSCPGRFYAVRLMKLVFGRLILDYDFKWATLVSERPPNCPMEGFNLPNNQQEIFIQSRHHM